MTYFAHAEFLKIPWCTYCLDKNCNLFVWAENSKDPGIYSTASNTYSQCCGNNRRRENWCISRCKEEN